MDTIAPSHPWNNNTPPTTDHTMTERQIALARRLFPDKRPRHKRFTDFYSERQLRWFHTHYPNEPASLIADIMHENYSNITGAAFRLHLRHTRKYLCTFMRRINMEYQQRELRRIRLGLPRLGKRHITDRPYTRSQCSARYYALRRGYILGDCLDDTDRWFIYYDDQTLRSPVFERHLQQYRLWVQPLPSWKQ